MSIAYPTQCALGRVAVYPSARSRRCCSMLRARLVTHSGGAPGAAAAKSAASWLSRVTASGRARAKRRPAVRGVRSGPQPAVHRAHRPQRQGPGLAPVAEMEFPAAAEWLEIDQVGRAGSDPNPVTKARVEPHHMTSIRAKR